MKFTRSKKITVFNNKGGVGKTTITFNLASKLAELGYKVALIDLDPQCNLSKISLGHYFADHLFSDTEPNIYKVLENVIQGRGDVDTDLKFHPLKPNLQLLPGSLKLSNYEDLLLNSINEAAQGQSRGFFVTSAIDRFLYKKGNQEEIDIFLIDTSPNLGLLNRILFLGGDYFITPLMPDAFSVQGIENLGTTFEKWKRNWKVTAQALARENKIPSDELLAGDSLFLGYIINSYNQYNNQPIKSHRDWMKEVPNKIRTYLSEKHCKNGLVETSYKTPLASIKDYGQLPSQSQQSNKAIFDLEPNKDFQSVEGTLENHQLANEQFQNLSENILNLLQTY